MNKRFQAQQALAKAQGAPASGSPPSPAQADPSPPAATLIRPGLKPQLANSTGMTAAMDAGKAAGTPWAFAMKTVLGDEAVKRGKKVSGISKNARFEAAKKMLVEAMGRV